MVDAVTRLTAGVRPNAPTPERLELCPSATNTSGSRLTADKTTDYPSARFAARQERGYLRRVAAEVEVEPDAIA